MVHRAVRMLPVLLAAGCLVGENEPVTPRDELRYSTYQGCYADAPARALPHEAGSRSDMTPQVCQALCEGYAYAGVQYYDQCFCGDELRHEIRPTEECNTPCAGDGSQTCGGEWRNSIYSVDGGGGGGGSGGAGGGGRFLGETLPSGGILYPGDYIERADAARVVYQHDGNLVLYPRRSDGLGLIHSSGTNGTLPGRAEMQADGNFVVYDGHGRAVWHTGSNGNPGIYLRITRGRFQPELILQRPVCPPEQADRNECSYIRVFW